MLQIYLDALNMLSTPVWGYLTQKSGNLMLVDADHFKLVNDNQGHHKGEEVWVLLARALAF
ncbi:diguanylate cyclase [Yersinia aldovae]|nr:diguanylate cyclase [Yersinia aldovae]